MASRNNKHRYINTRFWNDNYISGLDPVEKLLFIYLITNEHTNISGIYELPLKIMAIETGIDESMFKKILPRLEDKIRYVDGLVIVKNFIKHQETGSEQMKIGILNCLRDLDLKWLESVVNKGYYILGVDYLHTLCIPSLDRRHYSNLDLDSNLDSIVAKATTEFSFEEELKNLKDSERKDFKIIALYWKKKGWRFENKQQLSSALKRELKPAGSLKGYTGEQIAKAIGHCEKNYPEWSLETVFKRIQDIINK